MKFPVQSFRRLSAVLVLALAVLVALIMVLHEVSTAQAEVSTVGKADAIGSILPQVTATVYFPEGIGRRLVDMAVDPTTGYVYTANYDTFDVTVISGYTSYHNCAGGVMAL